MASYAIYNYQFGKIVRQGSQLSLFPEDLSMSAENTFPRRQAILDEIFDNDYCGKERIRYGSKLSGDKEYIHRYVIKPTGGLYIMRLANRRMTTIVNKDLKEEQADDYQNCIVIIDNRQGIQRILIEQKKVAFESVKQVERILSYTLNNILRRYNLEIFLMHLQDPSTFWQCVNDRKSYPDGFYKITFHLPHLNLERLRKVFDKVLVMSREVFDSDLEWSYKASRGDALPLDENNPYQRELVDWMMSEVGSENIKLFSNAQKRKAIIVGEESFLAVGISDTTIKKLVEDAKHDLLFGSSALEEIMIKTQTGIDPQLTQTKE